MRRFYNLINRISRWWRVLSGSDLEKVFPGFGTGGGFNDFALTLKFWEPNNLFNELDYLLEFSSPVCIAFLKKIIIII